MINSSNKNKINKVKDRNNLISVITVTYNASETLEDTIKSVLKQTVDFEYIIIDGGSTDGTIDIIKKYQHQIAYWISESDKGIYDAMNKGIKKAKGKWLYFLGADDVLCEGALASISIYLDPAKSLIFGDVIYQNEIRMKSSLGLYTWFQNTVHHQSAFYNYNLFEKFQYDIELKLCSDYALNLYILTNKLLFKYVPTLIAICKAGGASSNQKVAYSEINIIRGKYLPQPWLNVVLSKLMNIYVLQKKIRSKLTNIFSEQRN